MCTDCRLGSEVLNADKLLPKAKGQAVLAKRTVNVPAMRHAMRWSKP